MSKTKNIVIDDLNNSIVMENRKYIGTDREFMEILHSIFPDGVEYAKEVVNKAFELSKASIGFYRGNLIEDYGIYPFLTAYSSEYEEDFLFSMHIIFCSKLDKEMLEEWIKGLSLSVGERSVLIMDIRKFYKMEFKDILDRAYLEILNYLTQMLKCMKSRYEARRIRVDTLLEADTDYSQVVTFNSLITECYLQRRIARYNQKKGKKTGKFFIMHMYPDMMNKACMVSCVPYKRK